MSGSCRHSSAAGDQLCVLLDRACDLQGVRRAQGQRVTRPVRLGLPHCALLVHRAYTLPFQTERLSSRATMTTCTCGLHKTELLGPRWFYDWLYAYCTAYT